MDSVVSTIHFRASKLNSIDFSFLKLLKKFDVLHTKEIKV